MIRKMIRTTLLFSMGAVTGIGAMQYRARKELKKRAFQSPVALIRLNGTIAPSAQSGGFGALPVINDFRFGNVFETAFQIPGVKAVAIVINSPGGSPTQSSLMFKHLQDLKKRFPHIPLLAFVEDYAASGGYYIACAADEIIVDETSMVGSIGVIRAGFGFSKLIQDYGIERRVQTAGVSKNKLDPFSPETPKDLAFAKSLLTTLHGNFIDAVLTGRGARLKPEVAAEHALALDPEADEVEGLGLFDGSVYIGQAAMDVGLIDEFGECRSYLRDRFKPSAIMELKPKGDVLKEFLEQIGISQLDDKGVLASFMKRCCVALQNY